MRQVFPLLLAIAAALIEGGSSARALDLPSACLIAVNSVRALTDDTSVPAAVKSALSVEIAKLSSPLRAPGYCRAVADNFASKAQSRMEGVPFTAPILISTGVEFEAFRVTSFRNSGVAPKRYFGYLDERGRAAAFETKLKAVAARVAPILNAYAARKELGVTITPKEIVVTHIAEGGALLLSTEFYHVDSVHPVSGVGLDDYRRGLNAYADLVTEIDTTFGTKLGKIAANPERPSANAILGAGVVRRLERILGIVSMTFEESVLGTGVMYLWEKAIAEEKLRTESRASLNTLPLVEQYVRASLIYNSGILFDDERVKQIMTFDTASYLFETSEKTAGKRKRLPVLSPEAADALLDRGDSLPPQPTSWSAVYHILERYGAWVALTRFTNVFTPDGNIVPD